ncbi:MAG: hypothetical protein ACRDCG_00945, partial [Mycoplasmoidaceae bacterium]
MINNKGRGYGNDSIGQQVTKKDLQKLWNGMVDMSNNNFSQLYNAIYRGSNNSSGNYSSNNSISSNIDMSNDRFNGLIGIIDSKMKDLEKNIMNYISDRESENNFNFQTIYKTTDDLIEYIKSVDTKHEDRFTRFSNAVEERIFNLEKNIQIAFQELNDVNNYTLEQISMYNSTFLNFEQSVIQMMSQIENDIKSLFQRDDNLIETLSIRFQDAEETIKEILAELHYSRSVLSDNNNKMEYLGNQIINYEGQISQISSIQNQDFNETLNNFKEIKIHEKEITDKLKEIFDNSKSLEEEFNKQKLKIDEKISNLYNEISDVVLSNDKKNQESTEQKITDLYDETVRLISEIENSASSNKIKIEEISGKLSNRVDETIQKINEIENYVSGSIESSNFINESFRQETYSTVETLKDLTNNSLNEFNNIQRMFDENVNLINILNSNLEQQRNQIDFLSAASNDAFEDSYGQLKVLFNEEKETKNKIDELQKENDELKNKLENNWQSLEKMIINVDQEIRMTIDDVDKKIEQIEQSLDQRFQDLYNEFSSLLDEVSSFSQNNINEINDKIKDINYSSAKLTNHISEIEYYLNAYEKNFSDNNFKLDSLKNEFFEYKEKVEILSNEAYINDEKIKELQNELLTTQQNIMEFANLTENEILNFSNDIQRMNEQAESIKLQINEINLGNEKLDNKITEAQNETNNLIKKSSDELNKIILENSEISSNLLKEYIVDTDVKMNDLYENMINIIDELSVNHQNLDSKFSNFLIENEHFSNEYKSKIAEFECFLFSENNGENIGNFKNALAALNNFDSFINEIENNNQRLFFLEEWLNNLAREIQILLSKDEQNEIKNEERKLELQKLEKFAIDEIKTLWKNNDELRNQLNTDKAEIINNFSDVDQKLREFVYLQKEETLEITNRLIAASDEENRKKIDDLYNSMIEIIDTIDNKINFEVNTVFEENRKLNIVLSELNSRINEFEYKLSESSPSNLKINELKNELSRHKEIFNLFEVDIRNINEVTYKNQNEVNLIKNVVEKNSFEILSLSNAANDAIEISLDRVSQLFKSDLLLTERIEGLERKNKNILSEIDSHKLEIQNQLSDIKDTMSSLVDEGTELSKEFASNLVEELSINTEEKINILYEEMTSISSQISDMVFSQLKEIEFIKETYSAKIKELETSCEELKYFSHNIIGDNSLIKENALKTIDEVNSLKNNLKDINLEINNNFEKKNNEINILFTLLNSQSEEVKNLASASSNILSDSIKRIIELEVSKTELREDVKKITSDNILLKNDIEFKTSELNENLKNIKKSLEETISENTELTMNYVESLASEIKEEVEQKIGGVYDETIKLIDELNNLLNESNNLSEEKFSNINLSIAQLNSELAKLEYIYATVDDNKKEILNVNSIINELRNSGENNFNKIKDLKKLLKIESTKTNTLASLLSAQSEELKNLIDLDIEIVNSSYERIRKLETNNIWIKEEINNTKIDLIDKLDNNLNKIISETSSNLEITRNEIQSIIEEESIKLKDFTSLTVENIEKEIDKKIEVLYLDNLELIDSVKNTIQEKISKSVEIFVKSNIDISDIKNKLSKIEYIINLAPENDPRFKRFFVLFNALKNSSTKIFDHVKDIRIDFGKEVERVNLLTKLLNAQSEELKNLGDVTNDGFSVAIGRLNEIDSQTNFLKEDFKEKEIKNINKIYSLANDIKDNLQKELIDASKLLNDTLSKSTISMNDYIESAIKEVGINVDIKIDSLYEGTLELINNLQFNIDDKIKIHHNQFLESMDEIKQTKSKIGQIDIILNKLTKSNLNCSNEIKKISILKSRIEINEEYSKEIKNNLDNEIKIINSLSHLLDAQSVELKELSEASFDGFAIATKKIYELTANDLMIKDQINSTKIDISKNLENRIFKLSENTKNDMKETSDLLKEIISNNYADVQKYIDDQINTLSDDISLKINDLYDFSVSIKSELWNYMNSEINDMIERLRIISAENSKLNKKTIELNILMEERISNENEYKKMFSSVNDLWSENEKFGIRISTLSNELDGESNKINLLINLANLQSNELKELSNLTYIGLDSVKERIVDLITTDKIIKKEINDLDKELANKLKKEINELSNDINNTFNEVKSSFDIIIDKVKSEMSDYTNKQIIIHDEEISSKISSLYNFCAELTNELKNNFKDELLITSNEQRKNNLLLNQFNSKLSELEFIVNSRPDAKKIDDINEEINLLKIFSTESIDKSKNIENLINDNLNKINLLTKLAWMQSNELKELSDATLKGIEINSDKIIELSFSSELLKSQMEKLNDFSIKNINLEIEKLSNQTTENLSTIKKSLELVIEDVRIDSINYTNIQIVELENNINTKINELFNSSLTALDNLKVYFDENLINFKEENRNVFISINEFETKLCQLELIINSLKEDKIELNNITSEVKNLKEFDQMLVKKTDQIDKIILDKINIINLLTKLVKSQSIELKEMSQATLEGFDITLHRIIELADVDNLIKSEINKMDKLFYTNLKNEIENLEMDVQKNIAVLNSVMDASIKNLWDDSTKYTDERVEILGIDIRQQIESLFSATIESLDDIKELFEDKFSKFQTDNEIIKLNINKFSTKLDEYELIINSMELKSEEINNNRLEISKLFLFKEDILSKNDDISKELNLNKEKINLISRLANSQSQELKQLSQATLDGMIITTERIAELSLTDEIIRKEIQEFDKNLVNKLERDITNLSNETNNHLETLNSALQTAI